MTVELARVVAVLFDMDGSSSSAVWRRH